MPARGNSFRLTTPLPPTTPRRSPPISQTKAWHVVQIYTTNCSYTHQPQLQICANISQCWRGVYQATKVVGNASKRKPNVASSSSRKETNAFNMEDILMRLSSTTYARKTITLGVFDTCRDVQHWWIGSILWIGIEPLPVSLSVWSLKYRRQQGRPKTLRIAKTKPKTSGH